MFSSKNSSNTVPPESNSLPKPFFMLNNQSIFLFFFQIEPQPHRNKTTNSRSAVTTTYNENNENNNNLFAYGYAAKHLSRAGKRRGGRAGADGVFREGRFGLVYQPVALPRKLPTRSSCRRLRRRPRSFAGPDYLIYLRYFANRYINARREHRAR